MASAACSTRTPRAAALASAFGHVATPRIREQATVGGNLALACFPCNNNKGPNLSGIDPVTKKLMRLFHPRRHKWEHHFRWDGPVLVGRTAIGRVTVAVLCINSDDRVLLRQALIEHRPVGVDELQQAAVVLQDLFEHQARFPRHRPQQHAVEVDADYDETVIRTRVALRSEGFSILTESHVGGLLGPESGADQDGDRDIWRSQPDIFASIANYLKGYGWIKVFRTVGTNGDAEYWATSQLDMTIQQAADYALDAWQIEVYHRGLKQFTGIERAQFRLEIAQRNHIGLAIRAFVRLEVHRLQRQISYFEAKTAIIRDAMRAYLAHPTLVLHATA